jgi:Rrf2 family iron-sulfur cluster assembly transcriptional regulator
MRISTRGRFAITAMIDLALREHQYPVPLSDLALRHRISLSYLEQVFSQLRRNALVESTRGPGGGYTLGFRGDGITLADIMEAIEEGEGQLRNAERQTGALNTQELWESLNRAIFEHMKTITLHSLAADQKAKGVRLESRPAPRKSMLKRRSTQPRQPKVANSVFVLGQVWGRA